MEHARVRENIATRSTHLHRSRKTRSKSRRLSEGICFQLKVGIFFLSFGPRSLQIVRESMIEQRNFDNEAELLLIVSYSLLPTTY